MPLYSQLCTHDDQERFPEAPFKLGWVHSLPVIPPDIRDFGDAILKILDILAKF